MMKRAARFVVALVLGLGVLTWVAWLLVDATTHGWVEKDLSSRANLVVQMARHPLETRWAHPAEMQALLGEITHDERILAAAACQPDLTLLASTPDFPTHFGCRPVGEHVRPAPDTPPEGWRPWYAAATLPGGSIHVSAVPVSAGDRVLGFVILVHDLSYAERREATMRRFLLAAFGVLATAASVLTLLAGRLAWRGWGRELRQMLQSGTPRPEFQPILRDVRELVDRLVAEHDAAHEGGAWTPQRLKSVLQRQFENEKVVLVANREPYIHVRTPDGGIEVQHPASGLVTALEPVMRACSGVWVAHGSGSADREVVDAHDRVRVPPGEESYSIRRVWLSPEEERGYYYGFANEGLWPLCHIAHARPIFRAEDWRYYQDVNRRFADTVCSEVDVANPVILVHDYHFALAPRFIRERLPHATVITFWHIPWPNSERFGICPWREEILGGLLGSSILGFHTQFHCNNFIDAVDRFLEARIDRERNAVVQLGLSTQVRPYPISVEWPVHWLKGLPPAVECHAEVRAELGLPSDAVLGLGVDRLDYTKGIEERLLAVERLLERFPEFRGRFTFVQLAAPSRTLIERYQRLNEDVERLVGRINEQFADGAYRPVILRRAHHEPPTVFRYYRAADLCYVSSLHDGMNLVAKEFVAARDDEQGVLILSQFTGAARELTEALVVNPYDLEEASAAMAAALTMRPNEQRMRMRAMRAFVAEFNVYRWAGRMLVDAARLRRRRTLFHRLTAASNELPTGG
jgi:trehalose 6-phosphate synthase